MAKHRDLSFRPACESKESREGGGPEVVVGETVVNVEASAGVVGVEVVDGEAGAGVVDDAVAAGERSTVVGATVEISSSIFYNLGA